MPAARAGRHFDRLAHLHVMQNERQLHRAAGRAVLHSHRIAGKGTGDHQLQPLAGIPVYLKVNLVLDSISAVGGQFDGEEVQVSGVKDLALHKGSDDDGKLLRQLPAHKVEGALIMAWLWIAQGRVVTELRRFGKAVMAEVNTHFVAALRLLGGGRLDEHMVKRVEMRQVISAALIRKCLPRRHFRSLACQTTLPSDQHQMGLVLSPIQLAGIML